MYTKFDAGIRGFFATIDTGIYSLIGLLYNIIVNLANQQLFVSSIDVSKITGKLYSFIGIFMLFKLSFSLITYIINPDSISDKEKGGSKLIMNIVMTFVFIIICPFAFDLLADAQSAILDDQILSRIVFSDTATSNTNQLKINPICTQNAEPNAGFNEDNTLKDSNGEYIAMIILRPFVQINQSLINDENGIPEKFLETYCTSGSVKDLLKDGIISEHKKIGNKYYYIDYSYFVSTAIGIIIVLIFAGFCLDVALRTIKLTFLQAIAPIPIMSYIDPNSAKKGLFSKWLKEVGITWADLFLRLVAIYFAVFLISTVGYVNSDNEDMRISVIFVLGALMFAKKLPDMLKKMFNIDLKGDFSLNPLKKIQNQALGGKQIAGLTTGLAAGTIGMATSFRGNNFKERFANAGKGFKAGLAGGYKAPNSIKALGTGMQPYKEIRKKQKEADQQLHQFDEFNKRGQKLVKNALKRDENGNIILDKDGKYSIDETKNFVHGEYIESFNKVKDAKGKLKSAKEEATNANADLQRIMSGNLTDDEKNKIKNGDMTYNSLYQKAKENATKANENVDKMQGILDGAKERHKIVQTKYADDDALNEKSMKEFMDRNPDKKLEDLGINVNNAKITAQASHNETENHNNYNANDPYSVYNRMEKDIAQKDNELKLKQQQYNQETDMDEKNKISGEMSTLVQDISEAKNERERFNDKNPSIAADYMDDVVIPEKEQEIENYKKERDALYNTFKNSDASIENYGENYATDEKYKTAKRMYDMKEIDISKATENLMDLKRRSAQLKEKAQEQNQIQEEIVEQPVETAYNNVEQEDEESVEQLFDTNTNTSSNSSEDNKSEREKKREYLEEEKRKYLEEIDELRKYYGVPRYKNVKRYPEIEKKLKEIEDELYNL